MISFCLLKGCVRNQKKVDEQIFLILHKKQKFQVMPRMSKIASVFVILSLFQLNFSEFLIWMKLCAHASEGFILNRNYLKNTNSGIKHESRGWNFSVMSQSGAICDMIINHIWTFMRKNNAVRMRYLLFSTFNVA